jgi:hypothetical protein
MQDTSLLYHLNPSQYAIQRYQNERDTFLSIIKIHELGHIKTPISVHNSKLGTRTIFFAQTFIIIPNIIPALQLYS